jgi:hypothetical protein
VILLENSNEWNLFLAKRMILENKQKGEQGLKSKRGETSYEELHVTKKRGWNLQAVGRDSIKRKTEEGLHFPIAQNPMCGLIHTHTSFAFALPSIPWLFPFLTPFTTPFSINHDYLPHKFYRIFLYFYIYKVPLVCEPPQKY